MPTKTVNLLITILGLIVLLLVGGIIAIVYRGGDNTANDVLPLVGLAGPAIGALVTLLTRPPTDTAGVAAQVIANTPPPIDLSAVEAGAKKLLEGVQQVQAAPPVDSTLRPPGTSSDVPPLV